MGTSFKIPLSFVYAFLHKRRNSSLVSYYLVSPWNNLGPQKCAELVCAEIINPKHPETDAAKANGPMYLPRSANRRRTRENTFAKYQFKMIKRCE